MSIEVGSGLSDLVAILRAGLSKAVRFPTSILDWSVVVRLAEDHRVVPFVARVVRERGAGTSTGTGIPSPAAAALAEGSATAAVASLGALATLRSISDAFGSRGIRWLAWKGPALAQRVWDDPALRRFDDVDIVVHPDDATHALATLGQRGWRSSHVGMDARQARVVLAGQRAYDLIRDDDATPLELHWELGARRYAGYPSSAEVLARATRLRVGGIELPVPAPADEIVLHAVHATKHGWSRLEDVLLFARLIRDADALREAMRVARTTGASRAVALGAALAGRIFPSEGEAKATRTPAPASRGDSAIATARLVDQVIARWQAEDTGWRSSLRWDLAWTDGATRRARLLLHSACDVTLQEWRFVRLPGAFAWLYPLVRPLRLVARAAGLTR